MLTFPARCVDSTYDRDNRMVQYGQLLAWATRHFLAHPCPLDGRRPEDIHWVCAFFEGQKLILAADGNPHGHIPSRKSQVLQVTGEITFKLGRLSWLVRSLQFTPTAGRTVPPEWWDTHVYFALPVYMPAGMRTPEQA
jgi:hypothetical protein